MASVMTERQGVACLHVGNLQGGVVGPQLQGHCQPRRDFHCRHSAQVLQVNMTSPHSIGHSCECVQVMAQDATPVSQLTSIVHQVGVVGVGCDQRHERLFGQPELSQCKECLPRLCVILAKEALNILEAGCTALGRPQA